MESTAIPIFVDTGDFRHQKFVKTLAIETTCDDTSVAIVSYHDGNFVTEKILTHSQGTHAAYGGVVPELASRGHEQKIVALVQELMDEVSRDQIDSISVASRPGLPGSILVGVTAGHTLGAMFTKPVVEVNHILGHVFSILLDRNIQILSLPYLCLTVSGGHSDMYIITDTDQTDEVQDATPVDHNANTPKRGHLGIGASVQLGTYTVTKLMQTLDDAVGEAFDKVAKMLGGTYPGGPWISAQAELGGSNELIEQKIRPIHPKEQFSFSGVKAQVHSLLEYLQDNNIVLDTQLIADISHRFQEVVTDALVTVLVKNIQKYQPKTIGVVGGVSANTVLMDKTRTIQTPGSGQIRTPAQMMYCGDNAAMIGVAGLLDMSGPT